MFRHSLTYHVRVYIHKSTELPGSNVFSGFHFLEDSQFDHDIETGKDCQLSRLVSTEPVVEAMWKDAA